MREYRTKRCILGSFACSPYVRRVTPHDAARAANPEPRRSSMKSRAVFFHAGCPVCLDAERKVLDAVDRSRYDVEVVHLAQDKARIPDAERMGVKSVPALALDGQVFHINFGAALSALR